MTRLQDGKGFKHHFDAYTRYYGGTSGSHGFEQPILCLTGYYDVTSGSHEFEQPV